jgi:hypothetical protein
MTEDPRRSRPSKPHSSLRMSVRSSRFPQLGMPFIALYCSCARVRRSRKSDSIHYGKRFLSTTEVRREGFRVDAWTGAHSHAPSTSQTALCPR